jgi:uncharacterized secreted protein with C-terminal beta-propeller domain
MNLAVIFTLIFSQLVAAEISYYSTHWEQSQNEAWTETTSEIQQQTGITEYRLYEQSKPRLYTWALEFNLAKGWAHTYSGREYIFTDSATAPDTYSVSVHSSGKHSVDFNSQNPTIKIVGVEVD